MCVFHASISPKTTKYVTTLNFTRHHSSARLGWMWHGARLIDLATHIWVPIPSLNPHKSSRVELDISHFRCCTNFPWSPLRFWGTGNLRTPWTIPLDHPGAHKTPCYSSLWLLRETRATSRRKKINGLFHLLDGVACFALWNISANLDFGKPIRTRGVWAFYEPKCDFGPPGGSSPWEHKTDDLLFDVFAIFENLTNKSDGKIWQIRVTVKKFDFTEK